ncbi:MAG: hypothetical protein AAFQ98_22375 [Bacteroidota bacterium]
MKMVVTIVSYVLALPYLIFGLNYFFNFMEQPDMEGDAAAFMGILVSSGFLAVEKALEVILAALLFVGYKRPLVAVLLMPLSVGITLTELLILHSPPVGIMLVVLNGVLLYVYRAKYMAMLKN